MEKLEPLGKYLANLEERLSTIESKLSGESNKPKVAKKSDFEMNSEVPQSVKAYDEYLSLNLNPFLENCKSLDTQVESMGKVIEDAFQAQRVFLLRAANCQKPKDGAQIMEYLKDIQNSIKEMNSLRDNRSEWSHHQNMLNEGIQSLGWLCVEPAPKPFIESYLGGADFWGNKIRVQYKSSNPQQIEFVASFKKLLTELMAYVKEYHTTGVTWNSQGQDAASFKNESKPSSSEKAKPEAKSESTSAKPVIGANAIFSQIKSIDQSSGKTAGLKTVTKDMQTWRKEYKGGEAPSAKAAPKGTKNTVQTSKQANVGKPICELRDLKWVVENQFDATPLTVEGIEKRQLVYIYNCKGATIILKGKAKNIVLDSAKSTKLIFDSAVSSIEIVNCQRVQIQCLDKVPLISIDKTDGCVSYISLNNKDVQFVTSKSSEMNVQFPKAEGSDECVEVPIPEQFAHTISADNTITSKVSDLYS